MKRCGLIVLCGGIVAACLSSHVLAKDVVPPGSPDMEALRLQADIYRQKENEMQILQMEVGRLKLEVERKKAMAELGRGAESVDGAAEGVLGVDKSAAVLKYVFMDAQRREAVIERDGVLHRVKAGDALPFGVVKSVNLDSVIVEAEGGKEIIITNRSWRP